jgi:hypothetical protein
MCVPLRITISCWQPFATKQFLTLRKEWASEQRTGNPECGEAVNTLCSIKWGSQTLLRYYLCFRFEGDAKPFSVGTTLTMQINATEPCHKDSSAKHTYRGNKKFLAITLLFQPTLFMNCRLWYHFHAPNPNRNVRTNRVSS